MDGEEGIDLAARHGLRDEEALKLVAVESFEQVRLAARFDSFGDHAQGANPTGPFTSTTPWLGTCVPHHLESPGLRLAESPVSCWRSEA